MVETANKLSVAEINKGGRSLRRWESTAGNLVLTTKLKT